MELTSEQIVENYNKLISYIDTYISSPRREGLKDRIYQPYEQRIAMMPASTRKAYHNCFPGGYTIHVISVIENALKLHEIWKEAGATQNYTVEELVFSALNHDLGKMGTKDYEYYLPNSSQWHVDNKGEVYEHNNKITYMSVPDRSLHLLTTHGIEMSENEYLAIKLHDGMYEEANKPYLTSYIPEAKPRTSLVYIIHQADQMAARIEFEQEWHPKIFSDEPKKAKKTSKTRNDKMKDVMKSEYQISPAVLNSFFNTSV